MLSAEAAVVEERLKEVELELAAAQPAVDAALDSLKQVRHCRRTAPSPSPPPPTTHRGHLHTPVHMLPVSVRSRQTILQC